MNPTTQLSHEKNENFPKAGHSQLLSLSLIKSIVSFENSGIEDSEVALYFCPEKPPNWCILKCERNKLEYMCISHTLIMFHFCLEALVFCAPEIYTIDSVMAAEGCVVLDGSSFLSCTFYFLCTT